MNAHARRRRAYPPLRVVARHGHYRLEPELSPSGRLWRWLRGLEPSQVFAVAVSIAFIAYLLWEMKR